MAFAVTNKLYCGRVDSFLPGAHVELADQTATTAAQNSGVVGLKWARVKVYVKTFGTLTAGDTFRATLQVGTGASITNPENIAQWNGVVETGDTTLEFELLGSSQAGFQSWKVVFTAGLSHSFTADIYFDAV